MVVHGASGSGRVILVFVALMGIAGCGHPAPPSGEPDGALPPGADASLPDNDAGLPGDDASTPGDDASAAVITVGASQNLLPLDSCQVTPAELPDVPAGTYTITLDASTLSKGSVATSPPVASVDNYVVVQLPLAADDPQQDHRFFMLNGIGSSYEFTLTAPGTVQVMFIDSDKEANAGEATVSLSPGAFHTSVSAAANVLRWQEGCGSTPATVEVSARGHGVMLLSSTLSSGLGRRDDYVILRLPSEVPEDDYRYVVLNGVDASHVFTSSSAGTLRAWFISPGGGSTGQATLALSDR